MTSYQQRRDDGLTQEEWLAKVRAWNDALPGAPPAGIFDPSGLVPYPCSHGIPVKPERFPPTRFNPWLDEQGNERPPYGGKSWGRSKYLAITSFGGHNGVPYAIAECFICIGRAVGDDFYVAADGSSLR